MGIIASVYRDADQKYDCTMNGWSSRFTRCVVVNAEGPFEPTENAPAVKIVRHRTMNTLHAVSVEDIESGKWTMSGGNFIYSCDSRFGELCVRLLKEGGVSSPLHFSHGAVSVHDRIEG